MLEDRVGYRGYNLGLAASKLIMHIIKTKSTIVCSRLIEIELKNRFSQKEIDRNFNNIFKLTSIMFVRSSRSDFPYASKIAKNLEIPCQDVMHAILAKKSDSTIITQDKHFFKLSRIVKVKRPQDLI